MGEYLFYHIVDTPQTASRIIAELNGASLPGEVNFFALSIIESHNYDRCDNISWLSFDAKFQKVFEKICSEMPLNLNDIENEALNPSDLIPDFIDKNGALIGFNVPSELSLMDLYRRQQRLIDLEEATRYERTENSFRMDLTIRNIDEIGERLDTMNIAQQIQCSLNEANRAIKLCESRIELKQAEQQKIEAKKEVIAENKNRFEHELSLKFLTEHETKSIESMQNQIITKRLQLHQVNAEIDELQKKCDSISQFFEQTLLSRYSTLQEQSQLHSSNSTELIQQKNRLSQINEMIKKAENDLNDARREMIVLRKESEVKKLALRDAERSKLEAQEKQKIMFAELDMIGLKKQSLTTSLNRLRQTAIDVTEIHNPDIVDMSETDIDNQLCIARHHIKTYQNTNSFDLNILETFKEDRTNFIRRRFELAQIGEKISEMMNKLEANINTSIQNTFDDMAKRFRDNFKKFVPGGSGRLHLATNHQVQNDEADAGSAIEINGVDIFAQFQQNEKPFDNLLGQERRVASLVFIISMQQVCPAPFYLIDAIDEVIVVTITLKIDGNDAFYSYFLPLFSVNFRTFSYTICQLPDRSLECLANYQHINQSMFVKWSEFH